MPSRSLRTDLARCCPSVLALSVRHSVPKQVEPVTDVLGRIRRCQRSTCVTAVLPAPRRGWENSFCEGFLPLEFLPSNGWNDSKSAVNRQSPRPPELARKVRPPAPKTQIPRRVCRHGSESYQISLAIILRKISWMNFFSPPKNRRSHGASRPSVLSFSSSSLIVQARSALRENKDWQCRPNQATDQVRGQTCLS